MFEFQDTARSKIGFILEMDTRNYATHGFLRKTMHQMQPILLPTVSRSSELEFETRLRTQPYRINL